MSDTQTTRELPPAIMANPLLMAAAQAMTDAELDELLELLRPPPVPPSPVTDPEAWRSYVDGRDR